MSHRGPILDELPKYNRKYKWPDNRVKLYFPREVTKKWITFVNRFEYDKSTVKRIFQKKGETVKFNSFRKFLVAIYQIFAMILDSTSLF